MGKIEKIRLGRGGSGQALRLSSGQATLELTAALILVAILIVGAIKIFVWINARIVAQQVAYENSRVAAGSVPQVDLIETTKMTFFGPEVVTVAVPVNIDISNRSQTEGVQVDDSAYPQLNLF